METNAKIDLTMSITQDGDCSETKYTTDAEFVEKHGRYILYFDEKNYDGDEVTRCRFELVDDSLKMRRNGPIVLEQLHINDTETDGFIKTPYGRVETKLKTFKFVFEPQANGEFHLDLGYDLYTDGEKTGTYLLDIIIDSKPIKNLRD